MREKPSFFFVALELIIQWKFFLLSSVILYVGCAKGGLGE